MAARALIAATAAVQLAVVPAAEVAVCGAKTIALVEELGAMRVLNDAKTDT